MKRKRKNRYCAWLLAAAMVLTLLPGSVAGQADAAGIATDTLTIKVGYWGMDESDYVEKAVYHWTELDDQYGGDLTTYYQAYSFFQETEEGSYRTVIDSARGIYISDLLEYANVNLDDISGVSFYTEDQTVGYFTSFSYSELFESARYYFDDLSYYTTLTYDDNGNITGYNIDPAVWNGAYQVQPMLALEDRWDSYDAEYGQMHTSPNYEGMGAGNRFRLLFGQTNPDESRTNQTAKYTHSVYVALEGTPLIATDPSEIAPDTKIGTGKTIELDISTDDPAFNELIEQNTTFTSTDESVLKVTGVTITQSDQYEDVVHAVITYDVLSEGSASIVGTVTIGNYTTELKTSDGGDAVTVNVDTSTTESSSTDDGSSSAASDADTEDTGSGTADTSGSGVDSNASASEGLAAGESGGQTASGEETAASASSEEAATSEDSTTTVYELDASVGDQLRQSAATEMTAPADTSQDDTDTETLTVTLHQIDPIYLHILLLLFLLLVAAGAVFGVVRYRRALDRNRKPKKGKLRHV